MSQTKYIVGVIIGALIGWGGLALVVFRVPPDPGIETIAVTLFYVSLFFALAGTFGIFNYYLRIWFNKSEVQSYHLNIALRQGILLTIFIMGLLAMEHGEKLMWWSGSLFAAVLVAIELYFLGKEV